MVKKRVRVEQRLGLHSRVAMAVVDVAAKYPEAVAKLSKGDEEADASSVLDLLSLAAEKGAELEIAAQGAQADQAISEIEEVLTGQEC